MTSWPEPVERVASFLREHAVDARVEEFAEGTPTAEAAARAAGCEPAQIVKTLVFVCDGQPVLALVPGDRRADAAKVAAAANAGYARVAKRDEVVAATGFEPGAVSPVPPSAGAQILLEAALVRQDAVWIGAGSPQHMACLASSDLVRLTEARITDLAEA